MTLLCSGNDIGKSSAATCPPLRQEFNPSGMHSLFLCHVLAITIMIPHSSPVSGLFAFVDIFTSNFAVFKNFYFIPSSRYVGARSLPVIQE